MLVVGDEADHAIQRVLAVVRSTYSPAMRLLLCRPKAAWQRHGVSLGHCRVHRGFAVRGGPREERVNLKWLHLVMNAFFKRLPTEELLGRCRFQGYFLTALLTVVITRFVLLHLSVLLTRTGIGKTLGLQSCLFFLTSLWLYHRISHHIVILFFLVFNFKLVLRFFLGFYGVRILFLRCIL